MAEKRRQEGRPAEWAVREEGLVVHTCGGCMNVYNLKRSGCPARMSEEEYDRRIPVLS